MHDDVTPRNPDAVFFDAPTDAPFTCPPLGTAPVFHRELHSIELTDCETYTISHSASLAVSYCGPLFMTLQIAEGGIDGPVAQVQSTDDPQAFYYQEPHLAAEGDVIVRMRRERATQNVTAELLHRDAPLVWSSAGQLPYLVNDAMLGTNASVTNISAGPDRRVLVVDQGTGVAAPQIVHEYSNTGAGWTLANTYGGAPIGTALGYPALTADGLRMVFRDVDGVRYTDRPDLGAPFGPSQLLSGLPGKDIGYPFLDDDCGKLYFSGLDTVFYLTRQ